MKDEGAYNINLDFGNIKEVSLEELHSGGLQEIHKEGTRTFYHLRKRWSRFIMICIGFLILFQITMALAVGRNWLDYRSYNWFLDIVVGGNFVQIISLAIIVVKFLFNHEDRRSK